MEAALVTVSTGVIKPLLSKLFKLLGEEHAKLKGVHRDAKFIGDEMHSMQAALETLADEEQLDPEMRIWRDAVRELSYDMEDCVDDFVARVDHDHDGRTAFKKFVDKLKKPKYQHRTANEIGKLKTRATEANERHKRYFIVIDDVWSAEQWKTISLALLNNNCGSRIITTTRNNEVASCCSSRVGRVYEMEPLSFGDSKSLFLRRAFGPEDSGHSHLEEVSNEILRKCSGIPLAIITVSSLLADQHAEDEWKRVLAAIGSALAKDPGADKITKILSLSYFDLPHHLRTCLLYLSMFPEDSTIHKRHLIHMWIAEGFIREEQGRSRHAVGESYFNELINRCLIQPVDAEFDQVESCRVHDIILDFITCKAAEENFVTSFNDVEHGHNSHRRVRRIFVGNSNNEKVTIAASPILSHVRSLIVCVQYPQVSLLAFPPALRVLDLGKCWWLEAHHIASIEKLFLLKYLCLANVTLLPRKIGELQYLETLDITKTRILELPSAVTCLQRLTSLYIHFRTSFVDGMIGKMQSLEELMMFGVHSYEQGKSLQELSQLTKLWRLEVLLGCELWGGTGQIEDIHNNIGTLLSSCNLRHLHIRKCSCSDPLAVKTYFPLSLESWCLATPCSLREFYITYCYIDKVPNWMRLLQNLRELELYVVTVRPEDVAILGSVPTLLFLTLKTFNGTDGRILLHGFSSLKYLCLELLYCGTSLEFEAGSMPRLEHLKLEFRVHRMDCLNGSSNFGIQHLSALSPFALANTLEALSKLSS
ncbi:hypothetical protein QYE76_032833 [Lolium multiflorum]|uniref:Uncharacterized protein n=1 Tax=Lolium multiflorum TaxID=4521 RepID=A0AAD8QVJ3_LOLMU|nr:hypothetical protein QYE76_032833 [Lolium multiflorum]